MRPVGIKKNKEVALPIVRHKGGFTAMRFIEEEDGGRRPIGVSLLQDVDMLPEGKPITKEIIRLKKRKDSAFYDVTVLSKGLSHKGPARVTSKAYRDNWDQIFGDGGEEEVPENVVWN